MLLAFERLECLGPGRVLDDQPDISFRWRARMLFFAPEEGALLRAEVTEVQKSHISLLYKDIFQITVLSKDLPKGFAWDEERRCFALAPRSGSPRVMVAVRTVHAVRYSRTVRSQLSFHLTGTLVVPGMREEKEDDGGAVPVRVAKGAAHAAAGPAASRARPDGSGASLKRPREESRGSGAGTRRGADGGGGGGDEDEGDDDPAPTPKRSQPNGSGAGRAPPPAGKRAASSSLALEADGRASKKPKLPEESGGPTRY